MHHAEGHGAEEGVNFRGLAGERKEQRARVSCPTAVLAGFKSRRSSVRRQNACVIRSAVMNLENGIGIF